MLFLPRLPEFLVGFHPQYASLVLHCIAGPLNFRLSKNKNKNTLEPPYAVLLVRDFLK